MPTTWCPKTAEFREMQNSADIVVGDSLRGETFATWWICRCTA
ncbi:hypothetical protein HMPREF3193_01588 [Bifidobacterium breve]|nr:hypothetical protein HMPREF3193_01588 [Bifidobacterium breve]